MDPGMTPTELFKYRLSLFRRREPEQYEHLFLALPERERVILRERTLSSAPKVLRVMGERLGLSRERTRQLEAIAMGKLSRFLRIYPWEWEQAHEARIEKLEAELDEAKILVRDAFGLIDGGPQVPTFLIAEMIAKLRAWVGAE